MEASTYGNICNGRYCTWYIFLLQFIFQRVIRDVACNMNSHLISHGSTPQKLVIVKCTSCLLSVHFFSRGRLPHLQVSMCRSLPKINPTRQASEEIFESITTRTSIFQFVRVIPKVCWNVIFLRSPASQRYRRCWVRGTLAALYGKQKQELE